MRIGVRRLSRIREDNIEMDCSKNRTYLELEQDFVN
jgi:hypothetical protein